jgi:hypothetical protein
MTLEHLAKDAPIRCDFDPIHNIVIHRFKPGACRCRCGARIVRKPVTVDRFGNGKFGKALYDDPLDRLDSGEIGPFEKSPVNLLG